MDSAVSDVDITLYSIHNHCLLCLALYHPNTVSHVLSQSYPRTNLLKLCWWFSAYHRPQGLVHAVAISLPLTHSFFPPNEVILFLRTFFVPTLFSLLTLTLLDMLPCLSKQ